MSDRADRRRRSNVRQYSAEDQALNQISKEADLRLQARRAARAEAREIRLKEIEKQQKEAEERQDRLHGLTSDAKSRQLSGSRRNSTDSSESMESNRDRERDLKGELRELEDKYKQAMMTSATLDNEKQTLIYQLELLKDQIEEMEESHIELNREHKDRCRELEMKKRAYSELEAEVKILKEHMVLKDQLIEESGFVIMSTEDGQYKLEKNSSSNGPVPSGGSVLLSTESISLLKEAGEGSLGTATSPLRSSPPVHVTKPDSGETGTAEPGSPSGQANGEDNVGEGESLATGKIKEKETEIREDPACKDEVIEKDFEENKEGDKETEVKNRENLKVDGSEMDDTVPDLNKNNSQACPVDSGSVVSPELVTEHLLSEVKDDIFEGGGRGKELEEFVEADEAGDSDGRSVDEKKQNDEVDVMESEVESQISVMGNVEVEEGEAKIDSEIEKQKPESSTVADDSEKGSVVDEEGETELKEPASDLALNLVKENLEGLPRDDSGIFSPDDVSTSHTGFASNHFNVKIVAPEPDTDEDVDEFFDAVSTPSPFLQDKSATKYKFEEGKEGAESETKLKRGSKSEDGTASEPKSGSSEEGSEVDPVGSKRDEKEEKLVVEGAVVTESDVDVGTVHAVGQDAKVTQEVENEQVVEGGRDIEGLQAVECGDTVEVGTSVDPLDVKSKSSTEDMKEDCPQEKDESSEVGLDDDVTDKLDEDNETAVEAGDKQKAHEQVKDDLESNDQPREGSEEDEKQDNEENPKCEEDKMEPVDERETTALEKEDYHLQEEDEKGENVKCREDEKESALEKEHLIQNGSEGNVAPREEEGEEKIANSEMDTDDSKEEVPETEVKTEEVIVQEEEKQDDMKSDDERKSETQTEQKPDQSRNDEKEQDEDLKSQTGPADNVSELERKDDVQESSEEKDETNSENSPRDVEGFQETADVSKQSPENDNRIHETKTDAVSEHTRHEEETLKDVSEKYPNTVESIVDVGKASPEKEPENADATDDKNGVKEKLSFEAEDDQNVEDNDEQTTTVKEDEQKAESDELTSKKDVEHSLKKDLEQTVESDEQSAKKDEETEVKKKEVSESPESKPVNKTDESDDEVFVEEVKEEEPESPLPSPNKKSGTSMKSEGEMSEDDLLNDAYSFDDIDEVLEDEPPKPDPPKIVIDKPESESDQNSTKSCSETGTGADDATTKSVSDSGSVGSDVQELPSPDRTSTGSSKDEDRGSTGSLEAAGASTPAHGHKDGKKGKKFGKFFKHIFK